MDEELWTVVQHSGYGYNHNPQFKRGIQSARVGSNREKRTVEMAGGMLFTSYEAAEAYVEQASYPPGYNGLIPLAPGQFSPVQVNGLAVYVPLPAVV